MRRFQPEARVLVLTCAHPRPAEPLFRHDIQAQVLTDIFGDRTFRFTAPVDGGTHCDSLPSRAEP